MVSRMCMGRSLIRATVSPPASSSTNVSRRRATFPLALKTWRPAASSIQESLPIGDQLLLHLVADASLVSVVSSQGHPVHLSALGCVERSTYGRTGREVVIPRG